MAETATLERTVENIVNVPVNTARHNLAAAYKHIEETLAKLSIHIHGAILQQLGAAYAVRETETRTAIQEHQHAERRKQEAEANKPKLAAVTQ